MDRRRHPAGAGLKCLRASDLTTRRFTVEAGRCVGVGSDSGVVAHVLRLKRTHHQPASGVSAAESSDQQTFADIRGGALDHQRAGAARAVRLQGWQFEADGGDGIGHAASLKTTRPAFAE